ncbi:cytochrome P450 [Streptomyces naphthomycinicus]|uniref:cytochrome P450 n=1 Tax=Streptomyces naphthomycinicus TaxID=2872625 RepID=UPI001CECB034|nr:cytochrome P450 [Streptomyces sp. TML10]
MPGSRPIVSPDEIDRLDFTDRVLHSTRDLAEVWRHLRAHEPVRRQPPHDGLPGYWMLTKHQDVSAVYRDGAHFTSERGNVLDALRGGGDSAGRRMLSLTDGVRHGEVRQLLTKTFSRRGLEVLGVRIRAMARQLIGQALERGTCDFATDVAKEIPLAAICDLLGVPHRDRERIFALTSTMVASETPVLTHADAWRAKNEVLYYFANLSEGRRTAPAEDIVTLLTSARVNGSGLTDDEIVFNCYSLILGGGETTRMAIGGAVLAFLEHPGQWQAWRRGEVAVETAVDEVLRWTTPSMHMARTAVREVTVGGTGIAAGDIVTLWNVSANRDESVFDRPDDFRLSRTPNKHVTLGGGTHFCLGSHLARLEIGAVLESLRELVADLEPAGEPARIYSNFLGGVCSVPVALKGR